MTLIHFLKRSSSIFWIITLVFATGWITANPINSYAADAEGLYAGNFSGEQSGNWFLLIDDSKKGQIYFWNTVDQLVDAGKINFTDKVKFTFNCTYNLSGTGSIDPDGKISGIWHLGAMGGKLNGARQDLKKIKSLAGNYSGNFKGAEAGDLSLTIATNGAITGTVSWEKTGLIEEGNGVINDNGKFIFHTRDDTSIFGTIKSSGEVDGTWYNPFWETKGTLGDTPIHQTSGVKNSSSSEPIPINVENKDNSSGCFIEMSRSF